MTDYEKLCDFQNLYAAHLKARRNRRTRPEVLQFELRLTENLTQMSRDLKAHSYRLHGYYHFTIHEPKEREVFAAYYPDRVMLHCLCDQVLNPRLNPRLIYDNAACQVGKGTDFALDRLSGFLLDYYRRYGTEGYVLKCDIEKYFANIDHAVLKEMLRRCFRDPDITQLLDAIIDSYETDGMPGRGLPLGNQSSQTFAIYYLDPLDRLIKEKLRCRYYSRNMDDFVILHPDVHRLKEALEEIQELVENRLHLKLNRKTAIFPLKNGVDYLGWRFYLTDTGGILRRLRPQTKKRYLRRLKMLQRDFAQGRLSVEDVNASLASYNGHLLHGDTYSLREKSMADFILCRSPSPPDSPQQEL